MKPSYFKAAFALIIAYIIWGGGPPIFKWAFQDVPTFTLAFLRYAIPLVLMTLFFRKYIPIQRKDLLTVIVAGIFGISFNIGFYFVALHYTASINAAIIGCASPAFLILGAMIFLKERPSRKMLVGNLLGLTGVLLIVLGPSLALASQTSTLGNILLLVSTVSAVVNTLITKNLITKYHPITLMFWTFLVGTATFYPLALRDSMQYGFLYHLNTQGLVGILYGSMFASFAAWFLFFWAYKRVTASETTIYSYLQPVSSVMIAIPLVHEVPSVIFLIGSALVIVGLSIAENHKRYPHTHHLAHK